MTVLRMSDLGRYWLARGVFGWAPIDFGEVVGTEMAFWNANGRILWEEHGVLLSWALDA